MPEATWYVYIVRCSDDTLYTGITTDLERRTHEHNHSPQGARYTRARRPVCLVHSEPAASRSEACRREWQIKQLKTVEKTLLFSSSNGIT
ncbi:GIY-YIG nuclease family protein [Candidatus Vondammii sp. HM_W22]|uniref:GIY-YIG nuclease family protein n=1 Tax=Candidatus Vondammii sp. HM_W22 TaxID=2687299 RepID=UPI001F145E79|nr:GIY-YIG nuclease family protein [Candidatus Vondammii sp. HM_W22]